MAFGDMLRLVGGVILASRPSSRPLVSLCGPFDFPVSACGRMWCAVFVSSISCDIPGLRAGRFPFRLVPRLVYSVSWGVSYLFFAICLSSRFTRQFAGVLLSRLAWRFVSLIACLVRRALVSCLCVSSRRRLVVPSRSLVSSSSPCSLVSSGRLVSAARMAGRVLCLPSHSLLFSYHLTRLSHDHGDGRRLVLLLPCGCVFLSLLPSFIVEPWQLRKWACRSTIRRDAPFYLARFPHQGGE